MKMTSFFRKATFTIIPVTKSVSTSDSAASQVLASAELKLKISFLNISALPI